MPLPRLWTLKVPRSRHLSILCAWNWGPQLQFTATSNDDHTGDPGKMTGTTRGRFVRSDDYSARPSVVDSVRGGDCVAATVFVAD
jgi:hypothetical protein